MILVLERGTSEEELRAVLARLGSLALSGSVLRPGERVLVHVTGGDTRRARRLLALPAVQALVPTSGPRVRQEGRRFYPYHALRLGAAALLGLGLLTALAGFLPPGLGRPLLAGEPLPPPVWPWYLLPLRGFLALMPAWPSALGPSLLVGLGALFGVVPLLDRSRGEGLGRRWPALLLGLLVLGALAFLGARGGRA